MRGRWSVLLVAACGRQATPPPSQPPPAPPPDAAAPPPLSPDDRAILQSAVAALTAAIDGSDVDKAAHAYVDAMRRIARRHPDDFDVQYEIGKSFELLGAQVTNAGGDGGPFCVDAIDFATELVHRFDREARAHAVLAWTLLDCEGDELDILRETARCVALAGDARCRELHGTISARYTAPRCSGAGIAPGFAVVGAGPGGADREARPVITRDDVVEIRRDGDDAIATLTPAGRVKLRDATARLADRGTVVVVNGAEVLHTYEVGSTIESGRMTLGVSDLATVCATVEQREVPPALRLPAP